MFTDLISTSGSRSSDASGVVVLPRAEFLILSLTLCSIDPSLSQPRTTLHHAYVQSFQGSICHQFCNFSPCQLVPLTDLGCECVVLIYLLAWFCNTCLAQFGLKRSSFSQVLEEYNQLYHEVLFRT